MTRKFLSVLIGIIMFTVAGCSRTDATGISVTKESTSETGEDELINRLRESEVMIYAGEDHAGGVVIGNDGDTITILTVSHLMNGYDQGIVIFADGYTGFGDVTLEYEAEDLCFLTMKCSDFSDDHAESIVPASIDTDKYDSSEQGDTCILVGSIVSAGGNVTKGTVAAKDYYVPDFEENMLYLYADVSAGMSGAGVYTEDGYLIGLLAGGSEASEAVCIAIDKILTLWR